MLHLSQRMTRALQKQIAMKDDIIRETQHPLALPAEVTIWATEEAVRREEALSKLQKEVDSGNRSRVKAFVGI